jgi:hypothetical protein
LHLTLSGDKGIAGQAKLFCPGTKGQWNRETFFVPGQRDNGTSRPSLSQDIPRDVMSLGNTNLIFKILQSLSILEKKSLVFAHFVRIFWI